MSSISMRLSLLLLLPFLPFSHFSFPHHFSHPFHSLFLSLSLSFKAGLIRVGLGFDFPLDEFPQQSLNLKVLILIIIKHSFPSHPFSLLPSLFSLLPSPISSPSPFLPFSLSPSSLLVSIITRTRRRPPFDVQTCQFCHSRLKKIRKSSY